MKKAVFLLMLLWAVASGTIVQAGHPEFVQGKMVSHKYGPYKIGYPTVRPIYVEIINYKADHPEQGNWGGAPDIDGLTTVSMKVTSLKGEVIFRKNYPILDKDNSINIFFKQINLPGKGALLMVETVYNPSAEGTGVTIQFFSFNSYGLFLPATGIFAPGGEEHVTIVREKTDRGSDYCYVLLERSGNFYVIRHFPIYLEGAMGVMEIGETAEPILREEYPIQIDVAKAERERKKGVIHLYKSVGEADHGVRKINVHPESKVKFIGAKYLKLEDERRPWWLHVNIDGEEGYLNDRNEIAVLGLPFQYTEWDCEP